MILLSLYNEEDALRPFMEELTRVLPTLEDDVKTEVLMVNDGSSDNTLEVIREIKTHYECVR